MAPPEHILLRNTGYVVPGDIDAEKPHLPDKREEFFLQSDAEILKQQEKLARVNYDKGNAVKLPSKALCLQVLFVYGLNLYLFTISTI